MAGWGAGWQLAGWLAGWLVGWLAGWLAGRLAAWLLAGWLAGWQLARWLDQLSLGHIPAKFTVVNKCNGDSLCRRRRIRHQFQEPPPPHTSDANPGNPTAPSCPVRRKLWEPHPRRTWTLPEPYLQLCESAFIYDLILELFQRSWPPDTGHLDQKSRLYHTRFSCLRAWCWVRENCGLTTLDFPRDVLTRSSQ